MHPESSLVKVTLGTRGVQKTTVEHSGPIKSRDRKATVYVLPFVPNLRSMFGSISMKDFLSNPEANTVSSELDSQLGILQNGRKRAMCFVDNM